MSSRAITRLHSEKGRSHQYVCCTWTFFLLVLICSTGCYQVHRGLYRAESVEGWKKDARGGVTYFWHGTPERAISFGSGSTPDNIQVRLTSYSLRTKGLDYDSVKFLDDKIRVIFHDRPGEEIVPAEKLISEFSQTIYLKDSTNFTIVIPSYVERGVKTPELAARFHWIDKKYGVSVPLQ